MVLAIGGLVIDGSRAFILRREVQNALDAAVIAGAGRVDQGKWKESKGASLEPEASAALSAAEVIFRRNAPKGARASFRIEGPRVEGQATYTVSFMLLSLVGISEYEVEARASASPAFISGG